MGLISFWKMEGCGNDFMVVDSITQPVNFSAMDVKRWSRRRFGIGFDQLLLLEAANDEGIDFNYRIFNGDGTEVGQCGNGARCIAMYAMEQGLTDKRQLHLKTQGGVLITERLEGQTVQVQLPPPRFDPAAIPLVTQQDKPPYEVPGILGGNYIVDVVNMGNPHAVSWVEDWRDRPEHVMKSQWRCMQKPENGFSEGVNVGFAHIDSDERITLVVYERGVGETLACGSGACAATVLGIKKGLLRQKVKVLMKGGSVTVRWAGGDAPVFLEGPVATVFQGKASIQP